MSLPENDERRPLAGTAPTSVIASTFPIVAVATPRRGSRFEVVYVNANCAYVRGYGSREALIDLKNRKPVWSVLGHGWVTTPRTASDLIAVLEARGHYVDITEDDPLPTARGQLW